MLKAASRNPTVLAAQRLRYNPSVPPSSIRGVWRAGFPHRRTDEFSSPKSNARHLSHLRGAGGHDRFNTAEVFQQPARAGRADPGQALEDVPLAGGLGVRPIARTLRKARRVAGVLHRGVDQQPGGFRRDPGSKHGDAEDQACGDEPALEGLPRDVDGLQVGGRAFEYDDRSPSAIGQAAGLPEQSAIHDGQCEILKRLAFEQQPPVHQVVAQRKPPDVYRHAGLRAEQIRYAGRSLAVIRVDRNDLPHSPLLLHRTTMIKENGEPHFRRNRAKKSPVDVSGWCLSPRSCQGPAVRATIAQRLPATIA